MKEIISTIKRVVFNRSYRCQNCGKDFTENVNSCPYCNYDIIYKV